MKYNITLFKPSHPRWKIMDAHEEVIKSLLWGFHELNIECSFRINEIDMIATNILFGWIPYAQIGSLFQLPSNTILYNFEQLSAKTLVGTPFETIASRFQIWDYSQANIARWREASPLYDPFHAPISYAPVLSSIKSSENPSIDILYIGSMGLNRYKKISTITGALFRPSVVTLANVWGKDRDRFIGDSKTLINISEGDPLLQIFEIVRVSYYLANRKAVVCELVPEQHIEPDMRENLLFVPAEDLAETCEKLLLDSDWREVVARKGYETFVQRDVRDVLKQWLN